MRIAARSLGLLVLLTASTLAAAQQKSSGATTYRWVDDQGVVHYGDSVPPEYAREERAVLDGQGNVVRKLEAQKTPQQLAEEAKREQELALQRQHDQVLLATYASAADIERLRDQRLEELQSQMRAAELYVDSLDARLRVLQERALAFRPYSERPDARRLPDHLAEDIVRTLSEMRSQRRLLETKRTEQEGLRAQFQADIDRFRELKALRTTMR